MQPNYTADDVKRYRDENSCSIFKAKAHFERQQMLELVNIAHLNSDFDLLCDIVRRLVMKANYHET